MIPAQNNVLIELHVPDFELTKDFYQKLGFEIVWERTPEDVKGYLILKKENNILCFWPGNEQVATQAYFKKFSPETPRGYGVEIVVMVEGIEVYYARVKEKVEIFEELQTRPWGLKDFRIADPFGYYLRFTEPHNILDQSNAVK